MVIDSAVSALLFLFVCMSFHSLLLSCLLWLFSHSIFVSYDFHWFLALLTSFPFWGSLSLSLSVRHIRTMQHFFICFSFHYWAIKGLPLFNIYSNEYNLFCFWAEGGLFVKISFGYVFSSHPNPFRMVIFILCLLVLTFTFKGQLIYYSGGYCLSNIKNSSWIH